MLSYFEDLTEQNENNEWLESLVANINTIKERGTVVAFKIIDIKRGGFLIKIEGMYGYTPFNLMPWTYPYPQCWEAAFLYLQGASFLGKVVETEKKAEGIGFYRIYVDATATPFLNAELLFHTEYKGVVVRKMAFGLIVDIGYHFEWECGSLCGFLHQSSFFDIETFRLCEPGQTIAVNYAGKNEHGLIFKLDERTNLQSKPLEVSVSWKSDTGLLFFTKDGYKVKIPINRSIYGDKTSWIRKAVRLLRDGEIIICEVLELVASNRLFIVKWLPTEEFEEKVNWFFETSKTYKGKRVQAKVSKNENNVIDLTIEDRYKAIVSASETIYGENNSWLDEAVKHWEDGELINCRVLDIIFRNRNFVVKLLAKNEFEEYIGKTVPVRVCRNEAGELSFIAENTFDAVIPLDKNIYKGTEGLIKFSMLFWEDGEVIDCKVINVEIYSNVFVVRLPVENIEKMRENQDVVPLKIIEIKKGGFLVKMSNLCALVPFNLMPWSYYQAQYWEAVAPSLQGKTFQGKFFDMYRTPDNSGIFRLFADATPTKLTEPELKINENYQGIVILKKAFGVFIDIGYHFNWACGTLRGLIHKSKFSGQEAFNNCEPGHTLTVNYFGKNEQGLCFTMPGYIDLYTKYAGKKVSIKTIRNWDGSLSFKAEEKYTAIIPITKNIYEEKKDFIIEAVSYLSNGETIECQVIDVKENSDIFVVKWLFEDAFKRYTGKKVRVRVCRKDEENVGFVAEDKYKAIMPIKKNIYGEKISVLKKLMKQWADGTIINCEVLEADYENELFSVKLLQNQELENYVGTILPVKVFINEEQNPEFSVLDKYKAEMPIKRAIYGCLAEVKNVVQNLKDGDILNCEVLEVETYSELFVIKCIEKINAIGDERLPEHIKPHVEVKVVGKIDLDAINQRKKVKNEEIRDKNEDKNEEIKDKNEE